MDFHHSQYIHGDNDDFVRGFLTEKLTEAFKADPFTSQFAVKIWHKDKFKELKDALPSFDQFGKHTTFQTDHRTALLIFDEGHVVAEWDGEDVKCFVFGPQSFISKIENSPIKKVEQESKLRWTFKDGPDTDCRVFPMVAPYSMHDEYYPFIKEGVGAYFDAYMKSSASILIMLGETGTGKTSLMRWLIDKYKLSAEVTYDESVLRQDAFFVNYLTDSTYNLLVVEDADLLLTNRESEENKLMAKLLNISDGLVKLLTKKVIFSTNLANVSKIDPALIRPGRCYDVLKFRPLTLKEAEAACEKAGIAKPAFTSQSDTFTLAEIFNPHRAPKLMKMGFAS